MSMHLEGPWLSTTGKRRGRKKWASAEHKRQAEQLETEWQQLIEKHKSRTTTQAAPTQYSQPVPTGLSRVYKLAIPEWRRTPAHRSLNTGAGVAAKREAPIYTGNKVKGIGTMHKSNAVPIFSDEEAVEISTMRRN
jgi:hypothetical protein